MILLRGLKFGGSDSDTDLKIILSHHQNNFIGTLKIMDNAAKYFDILVASLSVSHYFN